MALQNMRGRDGLRGFSTAVTRVKLTQMLPIELFLETWG